MHSYSVLFCFASVLLANAFKYQDCGHNEIVHVTLSNCPGDVCILHRGQSVKLSGEFVANQNSAEVEIRISSQMGTEIMEVPGVESNGCNHMKCPLVKGDKFAFNYDFVVPKFVPTGPLTVKAQLVGEHGVVACLTFKDEVQD